MIELEDIQEFIDWRPDLTYNGAKHKPSELMKRLSGGGDTAFDELLLEFVRLVAEHPYEPFMGICNKMGYENQNVTIRKYIKERNPRLSAYIDTIRQSICDENAVRATNIINEILIDWRKFVAAGHGKLVQFSIEKALSHEAGKKLGYSATAQSNGQFVIIDKTKPIPKHEDVSDV